MRVGERNRQEGMERNRKEEKGGGRKGGKDERKGREGDFKKFETLNSVCFAC